ncbi:MAG TPA: hypothetical protein VNO50_11565 [Pyrinomonadaceae bacterium]|nr:hypothetical protein [Pyrinomonadaceae bacterium]
MGQILTDLVLVHFTRMSLAVEENEAFNVSKARLWRSRVPAAEAQRAKNQRLTYSER